MSEANQRTIDSYNGHIQEYIDGTPQEVSDPDGVCVEFVKDERYKQ